MNVYTLELTDIETACGVTLDDVAAELPRVLVRNDRVIVDANVGPALAGALARCAFAEPAVFAGFNEVGLSVYRRAGA